MLIADWNVEECATSRSVQPFVAIADEEVWIESGEVERDLANTMGSINTREDPFLAAYVGQSFERPTNAGLRGNGVENGELGFLVCLPDLSQDSFKVAADVMIRGG